MKASPTNPLFLEKCVFIALLAEGKFDEALELYRTRNPFPATCGRICDHPCQEACNRDRLDEGLAIRDLHRFLADREIDQARRGQLPKLTDEIKARREAEFPQRGAGRQVAIIGSGPAGLTCAWDLANMNYRPVIFEKLNVAGGMLRVGIPDYRLPPEVLDKEIRAITRLGVEIKLNTALGRDLTIDGLLSDGYKAVYLAIGAHQDLQLNIPGEDGEGVLSSVDFLRRVNLGELTKLEGRVVVVGGGNVAIDAARSALRLGAEKVTILYRRTRAEMPAYEHEVEDALAEARSRGLGEAEALAHVEYRFGLGEEVGQGLQAAHVGWGTADAVLAAGLPVVCALTLRWLVFAPDGTALGWPRLLNRPSFWIVAPVMLLVPLLKFGRWRYAVVGWVVFWVLTVMFVNWPALRW